MGKLIDITGQRFGKLTAIEFAYISSYKEHIWKCRCDCGKEAYVSKHSLTTGNTKSCGCLSKYIRYQRRKPFAYNCKCDFCGKDIYVRPYRLSSSHRHFCCRKCQGGYYHLHPEESAHHKTRDEITDFFFKKVCRIRASAKRRGISFSDKITVDYLVELWNKQNGCCYYSKIPLSLDKNDLICLVSVDRVDNNIGYEPGNIVLCASSINSFKFTYSKDAIMRLISLIKKYG